MKRKPSKKGFTLVELLTVIAIIGILAGILIPTISSVLDRANQSAVGADAASLAKAYFAYSTGSRPRNVRKGKSYSPRNSTYATNVTEFAAVLANKSQMNEAALWYITLDDSLAGLAIPKKVISNDKNIDPEFRNTKPKSWTVVASLSTNAPVSSTPLLWTRGLSREGTWGADSPWKGQGGHIAYVDGHVEFVEDTYDYFVDYKDGKGRDGEPTSDYRAAINRTAAIYEDRAEGGYNDGGGYDDRGPGSYIDRDGGGGGGGGGEDIF